MSLWQHPKGMAALCAAAVLACAAAPAVFLTVVDAAELGRTEAVADAYVAPVPSGDDYYILRQLAAQRQQASSQPLPEEETTWPGLKMYIGAQNSLESMLPGYDYQETANAALTQLTDSGTIDSQWMAWALDWNTQDYYSGYNGQDYALDTPYYATDSLGFVTLKRFALEQGALYTAFSLTIDSRTGAVTQLWISAPRQGDDPPPVPDEAGLRAFAVQAGLEALGDWTVPENSAYPHALYSRNGQALISATVSPYEYTGWVNNTMITQERWFLSLSLQPCSPEELPILVS